MLPWAEMWRAALRAGIDPDAFWSLSVREWRWLGQSSPPPLSREQLAALMETFPDG